MSSEHAAWVTITVGPLRQEWCERCLTSAALRCGLYQLLPDEVRTVGELYGCTRCDPGPRTSTGLLIATWPEGD